MAGIPSFRMRLMVGHNEFSSLLSQMDLSDTVAELDDSVAQTDDMEYIPGQVSRTLTASGRWTGDDDDIDGAIGSTLLGSSVVASSVDGRNYDVGTFNKTSKAVSASLGSRVNVSIGMRYAEGDRVPAAEVFRVAFPSTSGATTTLTGTVVDLGAAVASGAHRIYVYYFPETGAVPQIQFSVQTRAAQTGPWTNADMPTLTGANLSGDDPAEDQATYALSRYLRIRAVVSGAGRVGELVVLATGLPTI